MVGRTGARQYWSIWAAVAPLAFWALIRGFGLESGGVLTSAMFLPDGTQLRLIAIHPQPPNMSFDRWREALKSLPIPRTGAPWVLAGDFNATFDQRQFRDLVDSGYREATTAQSTPRSCCPRPERTDRT